MFNSLYFTYDGIKSTDMGISLVRVDSGMIESQFGTNRSVVEEHVPIKNKRYYHGVDEEPLLFTITISLMEQEWTEEKRMQIVRWLFQNEYKDFISSDNNSIVYKCFPVSDAKRFDSSVKLGHTTLTFRCDSSHAYSPLTISTYDFSDISSTPISSTPITFEYINRCNIYDYYYPELEFDLKSTTTEFELENLSNGGESFKFTVLEQEESIYVDNDNKIIITNVPDTYRLGNFNRNWFRLVYGVNQLKIYNPCILQIRSQFPIAL